jgi:glyoxylase-like metal-dependent hydrolase (beta-lactamase superfamily II)
VADFFKIADWPNQIVPYDLGGRVLDIIPTPGHQSAHIMMFDRKTRLLFSGDSLGPYRLYIPMNEAKTYRDSIDRVAAFTRDKHVSWILGAHIEMTTKPGELIPDEALRHPDEHATLKASSAEIDKARIFMNRSSLRARGYPLSPYDVLH